MTTRRRPSALIPGINKNEIWQIVRLTKDNFGLWWNISQQKAPIKRGYLLDCDENSKESLLADEISEFRKVSQTPAEVPRGYLAVYVGSALRRYIVPTTYLSVPEFTALMERAAEEFGFDQGGGLKLPCDEEDFEEVLLKCLATQQTKIKKGKK